MNKIGPLVAVAAVLLLAGCSAPAAQTSATHSTHHAAASSKAETEPDPSPSTPEPAPVPVESALVQQIKAQFPGYPLVVDVSSIDYRPQNGFNASGTAKVVALVPGLYMAYNPAVTDLDFYVDNATVSGDCTMMKAIFSHSGGECWDGVQPGSEEPH